jgi:triacylglycerol lipase
MKLDPVLLNTACRYANKAYDDNIVAAIKIESKLTSTTAYVIKRKTIDIIAFRGTQQVNDWMVNLLCVPVPYAGRLCHAGFVMAHKSVLGRIKKHIHPKKRTLICGHSLGGALAELSAAKLHKKHPNLNLVTFGKPNTFFKGFKRPMQLDKQISCVCGSDMVARIPRLCYGPSKSQTMLYFANKGTDHINPSKSLRVDDRNLSDAVSDHFMEGYTERLKGFLDNQSEKSKPKKQSDFIVSNEEAAEINKLMSEVENA